MTSDAGQKCKFSRIYDDLYQAIMRKHYPYGHQLPSEIKLAKEYSASRPTVARALSDLQKAGLIQRRVGSGSYVTYQEEAQRERMFGLLIPGLGESEIFEPICNQMASLAQEHAFTLLWGGRGGDNAEARRQQVEQQCERYIQQKVDGVFFEPLELIDDKVAVNQHIANAFIKAGIPVVLLDRDVTPFPWRSQFDLVGINNYHSGFIMTRHLLDQGCRRIDFVARPYSASTVEIRIGGYHEALIQAGLTPDPRWLHWGEPSDPEFLKREIIDTGATDIICANDATAAALMHGLDELGVRIQDMRLVGFDDVKYAQHLRVPLTTYRQPCAALGTFAVRAMLDRIAHPDLPPYTILLDGEIVERRSTEVAENDKGRATTV